MSAKKTIKSWKVKAVNDLLEDYGKSLKGKEPVLADKPDSMDMKALQEMDETKALIQSLKDLGISRKWLLKNGFVVAGMLLVF